VNFLERHDMYETATALPPTTETFTLPPLPFDAAALAGVERAGR